MTVQGRQSNSDYWKLRTSDIAGRRLTVKNTAAVKLIIFKNLGTSLSSGSALNIDSIAFYLSAGGYILGRAGIILASAAIWSLHFSGSLCSNNLII
jgi:hypothetical protein